MSEGPLAGKGIAVQVAGTGSHLPERVVTNDDLSETLDTSDEWIRTRTGIAERRFAAEDEGSLALGLAAAREALGAAEVDPGEVDLVLCATMTPDYPMPTNAALLQRELGLENAGGFDMNSACTGFVFGFATAASYVRAGVSRCALVVATEKMSALTNPEDRSTRVIFGDGAGAVVLRPTPEGEGSDVLAFRRGLRGDERVLTIPAGGSLRPMTPERLAAGEQYIRMKGRETYKFAVRTFVSLIQGTCEDAGLSPADLKVVVPHQVNMRILEAACQRSGIELDHCYLNIDRVGNTSAASAAIALDEAARKGRIERGDLVLLAAFGGGLSWGSALLRW
ncbi:MAG: ketoacyl-ACP synthase III [Planctomycetota bacterium]|nr:MAG: ketoacyl-ACP synthase III [Planctomycetota bacterium]